MKRFLAACFVALCPAVASAQYPAYYGGYGYSPYVPAYPVYVAPVVPFTGTYFSGGNTSFAVTPYSTYYSSPAGSFQVYRAPTYNYYPAPVAPSYHYHHGR